MDRLIELVRGVPQGLKTALSAMVTFGALYGSAILENQVQALSENTLWPKTWGHAAAVALAVLIFYIGKWVWRDLERAYDARKEADARALRAREEERSSTQAYAKSVVSQHTVWITRRIAVEGDSAISQGKAEAYLAAVVGGQQAIQNLVSIAYQLFESRYGLSHKNESQVDFEVTFMTKSYVDGGITIPASANRSGRAPRSMSNRAGNPTLYDNTVTAEIYRSQNPETRLVSDTDGDHDNYHEIYAGQKRRIKSSLIHPVFSPANELLGTLVVHCNRKGFFQVEDRDYWVELLEVFSRPIGLEKELLDSLCQKGGSKLVGVAFEKPF